VVDFLQLIIAETQKGETRARAVGQAAYALKALAKTLNVSMITLSQLARSASKTGEPPTMHDLKESGDIEASADSIVLVYNKDKVSDGEVALIVAKNRQGECRAARAYWRARHYAFTKVAMEEQRWNG
jgi:replicative DNA helicase